MALCSGYFCDETMRQGTVAWSRRSCNQYFTVLVNGCHVSPLLPLLLLLVVHASIIISHNTECELLKKRHRMTSLYWDSEDPEIALSSSRPATLSADRRVIYTPTGPTLSNVWLGDCATGNRIYQNPFIQLRLNDARSGHKTTSPFAV